MATASHNLHDLRSLSTAQKALLKKAGIKHLPDLLLTPPGELAKKLKTSVSEVQSITENACKEIVPLSLKLEKLSAGGLDKFTTGDALLDNALGGGIRTGMVWEFVGESSSGKTQLALQLSLLVQVKPNLGGIAGAACYLTTQSTLPTKRLAQLAAEHPLLSPLMCSLSDIHTRAAPTPEVLMHTLKVTLPALQNGLASDPSRKQIRLVVIDSISALFHTTDKLNAAALFDRSRTLSELSAVLHAIASKDKIAIVVINDVTDVFTDSPYSSQSQAAENDVLYRDQARWFGSAHSFPGENAKEAGLGLVWANQVNARIMMTRTNRRRYLDDTAPGPKRRRVDEDSFFLSQPESTITESSDGVYGPVLLRRLSVVFSSLSGKNSVDYVITKEGISVISAEVSSSAPGSSNNRSDKTAPKQASTKDNPLGIIVPTSSDESPVARDTTIDPALAFSLFETDPLERLPGERSVTIPSTFPVEEVELEDGGEYWANFEDIPHEVLDEIDFDAVGGESLTADLGPARSS